ncbi:hypothetical protein B0H11DRAFT_2214093 [Mycena galericulata]|nr:hypothetical protein B0H11DRAFT_2214093 [Mycena galericulata]
MNQALLRLLIHNTNSSVFTESEVLIPEWNGPPSIIVAVQILLYISLFSTLLAAFLAVLGKQWLMYYGAARDRGNMEQRCLERQKKVDGLRKWGFDLVMQISPILQQLALLLFGVALSIYLGTIQNSIAIIVFSLTCTTLRLILRALSLVDKEVAGLAFFTLHYSRQWFEEEDLGQILQQDSTLTHMGRIALELRHAEAPYLELVDKLSKMRDWKPILYNELPTWIEFVLRTTRDRSQLKKIDSIMRRNQVEQLMGCIFAALSNHWEQFKFQSSDLAGFILLVQCTMSVGLDKHYNGTASHLYEKLSPHLHASLANSRRAPSPPPIATIDRSMGLTHALRTESEIQELPRLHELQENVEYVDSEHLDADYPHGLSWPEITT